MAHHGGHEAPLQLQVALLTRHLRVDDGENLVVAEDDPVGLRDSTEPSPLVRFRRRRCRPRAARRGHVAAWFGSASLFPVGKDWAR